MLDRKNPPVFQTDFSYPLITPKVIQLSGGVLFHVVSAGSQEVAKIELVFNAGKWYEDTPGLSQLTASMLSKGTAQKTSQEIIHAFDQLGVHFDAISGFDFVTLSLHGLPDRIVTVLPLMAELISDPSFPLDELQVLKGQFIQNLKINLEKNSYVASCLSREALFGSRHPYGRNLKVEDIESISSDQLSAFHSNRFALQTAIVSGNINGSLEQAIANSLDKFPKDIQPNLIFSATGISDAVHQEKDDSVQSSIRIAKKTIDRSHQDYPALLLLNHALGGYFGSRLMRNIREEKGLTYGIYSSVQTLKNASYFTIGTDVKRENKDAAISEIENELRKLSAETISSGELSTVKNHFVGSLQTELSTPFAHAEKIRSIVLHGLSANYYQNLLTQIQNLSPADLVDCAEQHLSHENVSVVSVG